MMPSICQHAAQQVGLPRVFRIGLICVFRPLSAGSGSRCGLLAVFGSSAPSGDVWYYSGTRSSASRLCGRVHVLGTRFG